MPLQRCWTAIMFSAFNFSPLLSLTFCTLCNPLRGNSGCPRAAHKSVTYRSLRSILLAAQCRRQAKSQSKWSCARLAPIPAFGWPRLLLATTFKRGARKCARWCSVALHPTHQQQLYAPTDPTKSVRTLQSDRAWETPSSLQRRCCAQESQ
jgi:hypothetical protein